MGNARPTSSTNATNAGFSSLEAIPHIFSATRYEGFNDGILWEQPTKDKELIEPQENSIKAWENGEAYAFFYRVGARLCAPTTNTSFLV
ncbi:MAG: hypothetical protein N4J56_005896 [Chroococcidiopsis sp. SAG 2025]|uniref:hypothetical protein n=1 Tax=Chroococcidiopsis sp. SAG 2025 TaxID=171389 RepID=UPI002936E2CC|nr:hypothetical protein [Chroococcidiopsis sp. SAG 2025]MDV2996242.1 hypothetical protein [Chroococcidiopsis sp. SAG 2025]